MGFKMPKRSVSKPRRALTSDFRDLDAAVADGNARAALAKDMFNLSVKKIIGSYVAEMGGVDAIIFTAGVGENDRSVRWDVCEHLEYLGIKIDPEKNKYRGKQMDISIDWARVRVLVIPTNEELMIAKDTERLVNEVDIIEAGFAAASPGDAAAIAAIADTVRGAVRLRRLTASRCTAT